MVESGLALSGSVQAYIPFFVSDFSLQITLPALLFKLGLGSTFMAIFTSGICVALAFSAASSVSLIFTRSTACALVAPVILCKYPFYNFHYYPVKFPIYNYIFGQVGFYASILAIGLLVLDRRRGAFLLAGLMAGIHLPWAMGVFLFFGVYLLFEQRWKSIDSASWRNLAGGMVVSLLAGLYHGLVLAPGFFQQQEVFRQEVPEIEGNYLGLADLLTDQEMAVAAAQAGSAPLTEADTSNEIYSAADVLMDRRLTFASNRSSHNLLFKDSPAPILEAIKFFFIDVLLFASLFYLLKRPQPGLDTTGNLSSFIKSLFCFQLLVVLYKLLDEIDPQWRIIGFIHENLPVLLLRVIPNRWLNIDTLVFPVVFLAILFGYLEDRRNIPALVGLVILAVIPWLPETDGHNYELSVLLSMLRFQLGGFTLAFLVTTLLVLTPVLRSWNLQQKGWDTSGKITWTAVAYCGASFAFLAVSGYLSGDYLRRKDAGIVQAAVSRAGAILPAFGVQGYGNFNIFAQLGRPYYLPDNLLLPVPESELQLNAFCAEGGGNTVEARRLRQAECFAARHPLTWQYIGDYLGASQVLTRSDVQLDLPRSGQSQDFYVYDIE